MSKVENFFIQQSYLRFDSTDTVVNKYVKQQINKKQELSKFPHANEIYSSIGSKDEDVKEYIRQQILQTKGGSYIYPGKLSDDLYVFFVVTKGFHVKIKTESILFASDGIMRQKDDIKTIITWPSSQ